MKNKRKLFLGMIALMIVFGFIFNVRFIVAGPGDTPITFDNPLTSKDETELLSKILTSLEGVVVVLAVLMIVIGGIMYMASFGNDKAMTRAKAVVAAAVIGLAIVLAARTFLQEIWNILGAKGTGPGGSSFLVIATNTLNLLLSIVGVIAIIGMVVGGITYLTSYGDDDRIKTGKKILTASLIGLVICLASVVVVQQIINLIS